MRKRRGRIAAGTVSACEALEQRALLAVSFTASAYATPGNLTDVALGTVSGFAPIEPMVRVSTSDPASAVVSSHRGGRITSNGGASFAPAFSFVNPAGTTHTGGDTDMAYDAAGRLYWVNLAGAGSLGVSVSRINATTGASLSSVNVSSVNDDKCFIAADANPDSPFANNVYVVWSRFGVANIPVMVSRSTDLGLTWSPPLALTGAAENFAWPSDVAVAPNGDVYVAFHANGQGATQGRTLVRRSTDGGLTFAPATEAFAAGQSAVTYNVQTSGATTIPGTQFWTQGTVQPWVLPDPARPGNVYVVTNDDPNNLYQNGDDADIVFARSTNNGASWTRSTIASGPGNSFQLFPTASIDRFGNIVVAWYDNRRGLTNGANRFLLDVMATYSTDGGLTWAPEFRLNDQPFDPDPGAVLRFTGPPPTTRIGEYFGIDVFGNTAHVAWNGNTFSGVNPVGQQVWYSSFAIAGDLVVNGDDSGASTDDQIIVRRLAGNANYLEIVVNGARQYAGLREGINSITINGLGGADTISIESGDVPIIINGGGGDDLINLGSAADLVSVIQAPITVNGGSGQDRLNFNDHGNTNDDVYTITGTSVTTDNSALVSFSAIESLFVYAGSGDSDINVMGTVAGTRVTLNGGPGIDSYNINETAIGSPVIIAPGSGEDAVLVNMDGSGQAEVRIEATQRLDLVSVAAGGTVTLAPGGAVVLIMTELATTGSGRFDIADNAAIVDYMGGSPLASMQAQITSGYAGGAWSGPGITSQTAASTGNSGVGFAEATDLFTTFPAPFVGQSVDNSAILLRHALYGDANLDAQVTLVDFNRLAGNFGQTPRRWAHGDFTFDTVVSLPDFNRLASNFGMTAAPLLSSGHGSGDDDPAFAGAADEDLDRQLEQLIGSAARRGA